MVDSSLADALATVRRVRTTRAGLRAIGRDKPETPRPFCDALKLNWELVAEPALAIVEAILCAMYPIRVRARAIRSGITCLGREGRTSYTSERGRDSTSQAQRQQNEARVLGTCADRASGYTTSVSVAGGGNNLSLGRVADSSAFAGAQR